MGHISDANVHLSLTTQNGTHKSVSYWPNFASMEGNEVGRVSYQTFQRLHT